ARVFTAGLAPNPRMVKRTLNIFSLLQTLARKRAQRGTLEPVDPALLAKLVVIQARFRDLYHDLLEYPNLIHELELLATGREEILPLVTITEPAATSLVERYTSIRPLMRMLRVGTPFANLTPTQIAAYIHLILPTSYETATETRPSQRLFNDLLSGDRTRIRAAVGVVRQQQKQREYRAALLPFLTGERVASWPQRLSAGWVLGYLGDARDFAAVLEIPGGEFSYGDEGEARYLPGYRIGKYPVTNAQYASFLETHPELPVPFVDADWARSYNWDPESRRYSEGRSNQPVVLVTLREAQSYCEWVGGRLPTEEEWERAARGDDGRTFPWGEVANPAYANSRESGLGGLTPVGLYLEGASPYGLLDMAGNVWEWTSSDFDTRTKVIRGGAWNFSLESARSSVRECSRPDNRSHGIGFRVAFELPADED
ncbi:MAG: SUMF1/EgtB/PvdO family nonheme iron enzyme, partial [Chloroflexota bacterium]|nr:SUMF1/EgtB/PvdO family nonheme iron enzyme [Chloroflexota bacterium]